MERNKVYHGNNINVLKTFTDNSIDSIVTDPPYGINFMNKKWDYDVPTVELWKECLRVLKPGGHILVACGTRTQHRMAVNIEDAGFEIRDIIAYVYGSGFPKSLDISKAIDKKLGAEREVVGNKRGAGSVEKNKSNNDTFVSKNQYEDGTHDITLPSTNQAKQYEGWGTALKPSMELWTLARKPLIGTVAENVLQYGTGGINIDECRVGDEIIPEQISGDTSLMGGIRNDNTRGGYISKEHKGRFPANFLHDGSDEVVSLFPNDGESSASRFFYTAKASQNERNFGLYEFDEQVVTDGREKSIDNAFNRGETMRKNIHPTVKPIDLMKYLVRLITPKGGVCLDPFLGSGTTAVACKEENFDYIGIELMEEYVKIAEARIKAAVCQLSIFDL